MIQCFNGEAADLYHAVHPRIRASAVGKVNQLSFSDAEYSGKRKQTRREKFLEGIERVVPWTRLEHLIVSGTI